jgi:hypothetical protein
LNAGFHIPISLQRSIGLLIRVETRDSLSRKFLLGFDTMEES